MNPSGGKNRIQSGMRLGSHNLTQEEPSKQEFKPGGGPQKARIHPKRPERPESRPGGPRRHELDQEAPGGWNPARGLPTKGELMQSHISRNFQSIPFFKTGSSAFRHIENRNSRFSGKLKFEIPEPKHENWNFRFSKAEFLRNTRISKEIKTGISAFQN